MNLTNERVEMMVEDAKRVIQSTNVDPMVFRPDVHLVCDHVKKLAEAYTELVNDAEVILRDNDRLRNIEAAAKDIAGDADLMDDPNGWYGYAIGVGQYDRLKAACGG